MSTTTWEYLLMTVYSELDTTQDPSVWLTTATLKGPKQGQTETLPGNGWEKHLDHLSRLGADGWELATERVAGTAILAGNGLTEVATPLNTIYTFKRPRLSTIA